MIENKRNDGERLPPFISRAHTRGSLCKMNHARHARERSSPPLFLLCGRLVVNCLRDDFAKEKNSFSGARTPGGGAIIIMRSARAGKK